MQDNNSHTETRFRFSAFLGLFTALPATMARRRRGLAARPTLQLFAADRIPLRVDVARKRSR
eukprot:4576835-Pleurochrysis_carterae.AAC.1